MNKAELPMEKNWYILFIRGGRESQVINDIYNSLRNCQLEKEVTEIKVLEGPSKNGKLKNLLSGYIFVNCLMSKELLSAFYATPGVISFLNHSRADNDNLPNHLSTLEVNNFLSLSLVTKAANQSPKRSLKEIGISNAYLSLPFKIGDLILVKTGFFKDNRGQVTKIDGRKQTLTINVDFFGRSTPVSVSFLECEKL